VPIYEYRCPNGHHFERFHYKGSGFYTTDYGKGKAAKKDGDGGSSGGESGKTDSKPVEKRAAAGSD
jgi:predicted nucleic acid-binding Zn ribbon protein